MNTIELHQIFPFVSYDDLDSKKWKNIYLKIGFSIFDKSLSIAEFDDRLKEIKRNLGEESIYEKFIQLFLSLSNEGWCYEIAEDDKSFTRINLYEIKINLIQKLKFETYFKIAFPKFGILFCSAHDFSGVLFLTNFNDKYKVEKLIISIGLNSLGEINS